MSLSASDHDRFLQSYCSKIQLIGQKLVLFVRLWITHHHPPHLHPGAVTAWPNITTWSDKMFPFLGTDSSFTTS